MKGTRSPGKAGSPVKGAMADVIPDAKFLSEKYDVVVEGVNDSPVKDEKSQEERLAEISRNQEFARRTEKLVAALDEKNRELEKLAVVVESITPLPGMDPEKYFILAAGGEEAPDFRDGKIVALAKKTRKLTEALRKEKALATKLMRENETLEKRCSLLEEEKEAVVHTMKESGVRGRPLSEDEEVNVAADLRRTKKEMGAASKTIDDLRRKLHIAEQRTKAVERAMTKELGDNVKLEDALSVDSGWRGRAQQIVMLRNKIRKLESRVGFDESMGSVGPLSTLGGTSTVVTNYTSVRTKGTENVDTKAERLLNDMSETRADAMESIIAERDNLAKCVDNYKKRIVARDARISAMESDMTSKRESLKAMVGKADSDSQLIAALKQEISRLRGTIQQKTQEARQQASPPRIKIAHASGGSLVKGDGDQAELVRLRRLVQQQSEQIDTQDELIRRLRGNHK